MFSSNIPRAIRGRVVFKGFSLSITHLKGDERPKERVTLASDPCGGNPYLATKSHQFGGTLSFERPKLLSRYFGPGDANVLMFLLGQRGAHLLLQVRTRVLNEEWEDVFRRWYPDFRQQQSMKAAA